MSDPRTTKPPIPDSLRERMRAIGKKSWENRVKKAKAEEAARRAAAQKGVIQP